MKKTMGQDLQLRSEQHHCIGIQVFFTVQECQPQIVSQCNTSKPELGTVPQGPKPTCSHSPLKTLVPLAIQSGLEVLVHFTQKGMIGTTSLEIR